MTEHIGKYELLDKIAEGGFGVVFKARDPFIKRTVAIKTCPLDNDDLRRRFFREAEIAGAFDHPNVTMVHDFGVEEGTAFLVQEYLSGEDLSAKIRRREAMPLNVKLDYLMQIARGLAYAHDKGVIHRDIKPANVRILEGGQVKIMDFGIAKLVTSSTRLTRQGMAVGTVGYLAPEQLADQPLDHRTDLFSYGVLAYELFAYRRPFEGRDLSTVMRAILEQEPPPLSAQVDGVPPALCSLIHRCLAKRREDRPKDFLEVIGELEAIQGQELQALPTPGEGRTVILSMGQLMVPPSGPSVGPPSTAPVPGLQSQSAPREEDAAGDEDERDTREFQVPVASTPGSSAAAAANASEVLPSLDDALAPSQVPPPADLERKPVPRPSPETASVSASAPSAAAPPPGLEPPRSEPPAPLASPAGVPDAPAAASSALDPPAAGQRSRAPLWALLAGVALVGILGLAVVGGLVFRWAMTEAPIAEEAPAPGRIAPPSAPVPPPGQSVLTVLAAPWGEIQSVWDGDGRELPLPNDPFTPTALQLDPGSYRLLIAYPGAPDPEECVVELTADGAALCRVEFPRLDAIEYFRETGWWQ